VLLTVDSNLEKHRDVQFSSFYILSSIWEKGEKRRFAKKGKESTTDERRKN